MHNVHSSEQFRRPFGRTDQTWQARSIGGGCSGLSVRWGAKPSASEITPSSGRCGNKPTSGSRQAADALSHAGQKHSRCWQHPLPAGWFFISAQPHLCAPGRSKRMRCALANCTSNAPASNPQTVIRDHFMTKSYHPTAGNQISEQREKTVTGLTWAFCLRGIRAPANVAP